MELVTPYTMVVSGQTGSGKTHFVSQLINSQETMHDKKFDRIILAFTMIQPIYLEIKIEKLKCNFSKGLPRGCRRCFLQTRVLSKHFSCIGRHDD